MLCYHNPVFREDKIIVPVLGKGCKEYLTLQYRFVLTSQAIELTSPDESSNLARLYGNRVECWLRLKEYNQALDDALESVSHDGHWYKVIILIYLWKAMPLNKISLVL